MQLEIKLAEKELKKKIEGKRLRAASAQLISLHQDQLAIWSATPA